MMAADEEKQMAVDTPMAHRLSGERAAVRQLRTTSWTRHEAQARGRRTPPEGPVEIEQERQ
jgi:hypothetical protein